MFSLTKVLFKIETTSSSVWRRFSDFQHLATKIAEKGLSVPPLEGAWVRRYDEPFIKKRRMQLDEYLDDLLTMNPGLQDDFDMQAFLYNDEKTYKKYLNKTNYLKVVYKGITKMIVAKAEPEIISQGTDF